MGPKSWEQAFSVKPSDVFQKVSAVAVKGAEKARKRKASERANLQQYSANDNTLSSRRAYSMSL